MKHIVWIIPILLFLSMGCTGEKRGLHFTEEEVNVGLLDRNKMSDTVLFHYQNTSSRPVLIKNVLCTDLSVVPSWNRSPLLPGMTEVLKAVMPPGKWNGPFAVRLMVYTGEGEEPYRLKFKGSVEKVKKDIFKYDLGGGLKVNEPFIRLGQVFAGETVTDTLWVYNGTPEIKACIFSYNVKNLRVKVDKEYLNPGDTARVTVTFAPENKDKYGDFNEPIFWLNNKDTFSRTISIGVSARVVENFLQLTAEERELAPRLVLEESEHDFGDVQEGVEVSRKFQIKNEGKRDLILRDVKASCGCTVTEVERKVIPPGESTDLMVTFNSAGREGKQQKTVLVTCNDYRASNFVLSVQANVLKKE